jgi:hypothetical protein
MILSLPVVSVIGCKYLRSWFFVTAPQHTDCFLLKLPKFILPDALVT